MTDWFKASIEQVALLKCLARMSRVIEKRTTIPILGNVLLVLENDRLLLTATDLDIKLTDSLPARIAQPGATTLPAQLLHDIVRKMPAGSEILIEQPDSATGSVVTVKCGRSRFTVQSLPSADFPNMDGPDGNDVRTFDIQGGDLLRLIGLTDFAISSEETRYYLNGIYLHTAGGDNSGTLRAVATDGHRLAQAEFPVPDDARGMRGVIVPRKTVGEIARLFVAEDEITVSVSANKIRLSRGDIELTSKLIDGTFPDYGRVVPTNNERTLVVDRRALEDAAGRVSVVSSEKGRAVKLAIESGKLTLTVNSPDTGSATEEIEAEFDSAPMEIGFNGRYLEDILRRVQGDKVTVKLADPGSPTLFAGEDPNSLYVLMPMRV